MHWDSAFRRALGAIGAAGLAVLAGAVPAVAGSSAAAKPHDVMVKVAGIGLGGQPVTIPSNQVSLWALTGAGTMGGPYYNQPGGGFRVPPGKYLVGGYVPTSNGHYQNTVVVRQVGIKASGTITLDSRGAKPFSVALTGASATLQGQFADVCVRGGSGARAWATSFLPSYVTPGGSQFVKQLADKSLLFVYHGLFASTSGTLYDVAGARPGGLPAHPAYSARAAALAKLTVAARSGTVAGSQWGLSLGWRYGTTNCGADLSPDIPILKLPGQQTQYVSPGLLSVDVLGIGQGQNFSFGRDVRVTAGHSYAATFGSAVAGPTSGTPVLVGGELCSDAGAIYGDPLASGWQSDGTGKVTLRRASKLLGQRRFGNSSMPCFRVGHKAGWYTMTESAHHARPAAGVAPAALSTDIVLTWHLRIPALSAIQYGNDLQLPATLTTFEPAGLSPANQAATGPTRIVLHVIRNGGYGSNMALSYPLRSVQVQYSVNAGRTWQSVPVIARRGYWVVTVPSTGAFMSLRSTVTDVRGNTTVETIQKAYGVS